MRPEVWKAYQWLQTDSAYPNGPMSAALCHVERAVGCLFPRSAGDRVLVVGPGTHHELDVLTAGLDHNHTMKFTALTQYDVECAQLKTAGYDAVLGDIHDTPFADESFDLIFSSNVFEHVFAPYVALMECRRLLRTGGTFYAVIPTFETAGGGVTPWHTTCLDLNLWRELLNKSGFVSTMSSTVLEKAVGAGETYHNLRAQAVPLREPHAEVMRRVKEARR